MTADVAANLARVQERIVAACRRADRDPAEVRLLPVSKTHGVDVVAAAYEAGAREFGENRIQELSEKAAALADRADLRWSVIGHLQRNKAKVAAELASEFQALDSLEIAIALDRRRSASGRPLDVLIQVNSSGESQKYGVTPDAVVDLARELRHCGALRVRGLMTVAVFSADEAAVARCFTRMREVQETLRQTGDAAGSYDELSMGMSGDFELAVAHGATCVRVGQAIFGPR